MSKQRKATKLEKEFRLGLIMDMIVNGTESPVKIREVLLEYYRKQRGEELDLTLRQVENYVSKCFAKITAEGKDSEPYVFDMLVKRNENIYQKAASAKQYTAAIAALREIAKLHGAYKPEKHELTGKDGEPIETVTKFDYKSLGTDKLRQLISILESAQSE